MGVSLDDVLGNKNDSVLEDKSKKQLNLLLVVIVIVIIAIITVVVQMTSANMKKSNLEWNVAIGTEVEAISSKVKDYYELYSKGNYTSLIGISQEKAHKEEIKYVNFGNQKLEYKYGYYFVTMTEMADAKLLGSNYSNVKTRSLPTSKDGYLVNYKTGDVVYLSGLAYVNNGKRYYELSDISAIKLIASKQLDYGSPYNTVPPSITIPSDVRVVISSPDDMLKLQNSQTWGGTYVLNSDIDMSNVKGWEPLGNANQKFTGSFDGRGYIISNLKIDDAYRSYVGFFGYIGSTGVVDRLFLKDVDVHGGENTGAIAGICEGTVTNCKISGNVTSGSSDNAGGAFGKFTGTAVDILCKVNTHGKNMVGGFAGSAEGGSITNVFVNENVVVDGEERVGGLIGAIISSRAVNVDQTYAKASVSATKGGSAGGLVGYIYSTSTVQNYAPTIKHSYSMGEIKNCPKNAGGFIGEMYANSAGTASILLCYTKCQVDRNCVNNRGAFVGCIQPSLQPTVNFNASKWIRANNDSDVNGELIRGIGSSSSGVGQYVDELSQNFTIDQFNGWNDGVWKLETGKNPYLISEPKQSEWSF